MKSLTRSVLALSLLAFASAPFAQDEEVADEGGGWFEGVTSFFSGLFGGDEDGSEAVEEAPVEEASAGGTFGGLEWYLGADAGVTKHQPRELRSAKPSLSAYGGGILANRWGFELAYLDMGDADVRNATPDLAVDGFRGGVTYNTESGDAPVRVGLGYYSVDASLGNASESSSGFAVGVKFEQAVTERLYLTLGTDLLFGVKLGGQRSDSIMFGIGLAFHTAPPALAEPGEDEGVTVTEPAFEDAAPQVEEAPVVYETPESYETPADTGSDATGSGEPVIEEPAEAPEEEPYE